MLFRIHIHMWEWYDSREVNHYETSNSKRPFMTTTEVSGICIRCGEPRVKKINGAWSIPGPKTRTNKNDD